jgi:DNA-binding CsgD family transcriptional regulator
MIASPALRERGFGEMKRLCYAGLDAPTLLRAVATRLARLAPFDAYCAQTNDPVSGLLTQVFTTEAFGDQEHRQYLEQIYFQEDREEQRRMVQNRIPVVRLSDVTDGRLERAFRYRELTGPLGLGYEALAICAVGRQQWGGINLIRERGRPDFDAREVALLRRLAAHIGAGLQAAALRALATTKAEGDSVPGMLVLDDRGQVMQHTQAAEHYLGELDDLRPDWRDGRGLPAPVWNVVGALRKTLAPETERDRQSAARICVQTRAGRWLTLHGARTLSDGGLQGETVVIIEPSQPRELAWLRAFAYGLSERERAVVDCVTQGASTKEIAAALCISEYTVQEHLSHVFDKVGVRSRQTLVQRLFFDHLAPQILTSPEQGSGLG